MKLYKFYADWCGPCHMMKPVAEKLAADHNLELIEVNIETSPEQTASMGIQSIPTLVLVNEEGEVARVMGLNTKARLASALGLS